MAPRSIPLFKKSIRGRYGRQEGVENLPPIADAFLKRLSESQVFLFDDR